VTTQGGDWKSYDEWVAHFDPSKVLEKADKEKKEQDQVQEDMFVALETSYAIMQNTVSDEVQKVIDILGGIMAPPKEDEEDEEADDDDDDEEA
jgi:hypothetical protein